MEKFVSESDIFRMVFLRIMDEGPDKIALKYKPGQVWVKFEAALRIAIINHKKPKTIKDLVKRNLTTEEAIDCAKKAFFAMLDEYKEDTIPLA